MDIVHARTDVPQKLGVFCSGMRVYMHAISLNIGPVQSMIMMCIWQHSANLIVWTSIIQDTDTKAASTVSHKF